MENVLGKNKKTNKIFLIALILIYPCYKGIRELLWVKHSSYTIDNILTIKLRVDDDIISFQDFDNDKTITLTNSETKAKMKVSYISLEPNLYFYLDTINSKKAISIVDQFSGQNFYDYATLKLVNTKDCFNEFGGCDGFNNDSLLKLKKPFLTYDENGFHQ